MRALVRPFFTVLAILGVPSLLFAQASIVGGVKDASGAVLPGVTVEASSAALIEKVRTAATDGSGQYRIDDLRPGSYVVTFSLSGFSTVRREGIELTGSFAATVNADLRVGTVSETITVQGQTPVVDVVNAKQQTTVTNEMISAAPTARLYHSIVALVPGVSLSGSQDVGGLQGPVTVTFNMRGGPGNEGRLTSDGLTLGSSLNGTGVSYTVADVGNAQEIVFTTAGGLGESEVGGPAMNVVPRQGGNNLSGTFFTNWANDKFQTSNFTPEIQAAGLRAPNLMVKIWDVNGAFGGPIKKDKLWYFAAVRYQGNRKLVGGAFANRNAGNVTSWNYEADTTQQALDDGTWRSGNIRLTWQASPRNKFNFYQDQQWLCTSCNGGGSATTAPEARSNNHAMPQVQQVTWTSPRTSRLLLEAGFGTNNTLGYGVHFNLPNGNQLIPVTEQCTAGCATNGNIAGLSYRNNSSYVADAYVFNWRASVTYVTGRHSAKFGYIGLFLANHFPNTIQNDSWTSYRFNNGIPNQFTQTAGPALFNTHVRDASFYAQDQWTLRKMTVSAAIRYDRPSGFFPEQHVGPNPFVPVPIVLAAQNGTSYHDITPRLGVSYDVFGNGRTAVKFNLGKYLAAADGSSITGALTNPIGRISTSANRTWTDANANYKVDCDLTNLQAQNNLAGGGDFCGLASNLNFATPVITTTYDPAILHGWGIRPYDWNVGIQVQQELLPRVSVNIGYYRRIFGNFLATDNRVVSAADFDSYSVTVPQDPRLPTAGHVITGLYDVNPTFSGQSNNYVSMADNFGSQYNHWNGVEVNFTARVRQGLMFQGGSSTGRTITDSCAVRAVLPELGISANGYNPYCRVENPFLTQFKGLGSYTIPKIDVQLSTAFQSIPGSNLSANLSVPSATVAQTLGRPLSGNATNVTINVVTPGSVLGDRINQIDFRVGKIVKFGRFRSQFSVDLYNALNTSAIQTYNQSYVLNSALTGAWLVPTAIMPARFAKLTAQIDF
ncbi:MAG: carboxypeptidase regulatory-like domain-containing protein [Acidobacteriota bacterium]